jgi:hypothetical protein
MNATKKIVIAMMGISSLATVTLSAGPVVVVQVPAPVVTVPVPAPAPAITVETVPDTYVWDGYEYVGIVGAQYYYLGPGNVWLVLDPARSVRFHDWERDHADWLAHAIHNDIYRHDARGGHEVPLHDDHVPNVSHDNHDNNAPDNGTDKDHDHDH